MLPMHNKFVVIAFYKFTRLENYRELKTPLLGRCVKTGIRGTILLAAEGINGTVAGTRTAVDDLLSYLKSDARLAKLEYKESFCDTQPFYRTKVKLKKEIVTLGVAGVDPNQQTGQFVEPSQWNELISDPNVLVIDTRNDYEIGIGSFKNALNPNTGTFREFPTFVQENLLNAKHKKVATFCTGGIRSEKCSAYLLQQGFQQVYQLKGGILKYLEDVPAAESLWQGECFVFDNRVAVDKNLEQGQFDQCHGCRTPLSAADRQSELYQAGVHCPHCYNKLTADQLSRFNERHKQVQLARRRNQQHIGNLDCVKY